jgi:tetratricopeptide (TPR) repeat protein
MPAEPEDRTRSHNGCPPGRERRISTFFAFLALAACSGTSESDPEAVPATGGTAAIDAQIVSRRYRAALDSIEAGLRDDPGSLELLDRKLDVLRRLGLERQALELALDLRKRLPDEARYAYEAGELAARIGDESEARRHFAEARKLAPDDWRPSVGEAALMLEARPPEVDSAEVLLRPWVDGPDAKSEALYHLALVQELKREAPAARATLERALALDPDHVPSLCNAARLAEAAGDRAAARALLVRAKAAAPVDDTTLQRELAQRIDALASPTPAPDPKPTDR